MSKKANSFASIISAPMPTHNYWIEIPDIPEWMPQLVESAGFPQETMSTVKLTLVGGEEVDYPSTPTNTHTWSFKIPESDRAAVYEQFDKISAGWDQTLGVVVAKKWRTVKIYLRDLEDNIIMGKELHGCWLQKLGDVSLASNAITNPVKWDYTFVFSWMRDLKPSQFKDGLANSDKQRIKDLANAELNVNGGGGPMRIVDESAVRNSN